MVVIGIILLRTRFAEGIGESFYLSLKRVVDFFVMVNSSAGTFESKFSHVVHVDKHRQHAI